MKRVITYSDNKDKALAVKTLHTICADIISGNGNSVTLLKRLSGCFIYNCLFLIPEHILVNGNQYSYESICYYVPGLLSRTLHEMLEAFGEICLSNANVLDDVKKLLHDCMFGEVVSLLGNGVTKEFYTALFVAYCRLLNDDIKLKQVMLLYQDNRTGIAELQTYFETEVQNNGKGLY